MEHIGWERVSAIAESISALGIVLLWIQLTIYKWEIRNDHERSRRENAVNFLLEWSKGFGRNASLTKKLVEQFDEEQIQSLFEMRPLRISEEHRNLIIACLDMNAPADGLSGVEGMIELNESQVKVIKWQTVSYLNLLEAILSAWRHNIADRDIIEEQFSPLVVPEKGMTMLENYRGVAGGSEALPAVAEFVRTVLKKRNDKKIAMEAQDLKRRADELKRKNAMEAEKLKKALGKPPIG
jgi:hypothetical protein